MKKILCICTAILLLAGCGAEPEPIPTPTPTATPVITPVITPEITPTPTPEINYKYNKYDFGEYQKDGLTCIGYNIAFTDDGGSKMDAMEGVWNEYAYSDGYNCHTMWFYTSDEAYQTGPYDLAVWEDTPEGMASKKFVFE